VPPAFFRIFENSYHNCEKRKVARFSFAPPQEGEAALQSLNKILCLVVVIALFGPRPVLAGAPVSSACDEVSGFPLPPLLPYERNFRALSKRSSARIYQRISESYARYFEFIENGGKPGDFTDPMFRENLEWIVSQYRSGRARNRFVKPAEDEKQKQEFERAAGAMTLLRNEYFPPSEIPALEADRASKEREHLKRLQSLLASKTPISMQMALDETLRYFDPRHDSEPGHQRDSFFFPGFKPIELNTPGHFFVSRPAGRDRRDSVNMSSTSIVDMELRINPGFFDGDKDSAAQFWAHDREHGERELYSHFPNLTRSRGVQEQLTPSELKALVLSRYRCSCHLFDNLDPAQTEILTDMIYAANYEILAAAGQLSPREQMQADLEEARGFMKRAADYRSDHVGGDSVLAKLPTETRNAAVDGVANIARARLANLADNCQSQTRDTEAQPHPAVATRQSPLRALLEACLPKQVSAQNRVQLNASAGLLVAEQAAEMLRRLPPTQQQTVVNQALMSVEASSAAATESSITRRAVPTILARGLRAAALLNPVATGVVATLSNGIGSAGAAQEQPSSYLSQDGAFMCVQNQDACAVMMNRYPVISKFYQALLQNGPASAP